MKHSSQTVALTLFALQSIPSRLCASLVTVVGIMTVIAAQPVPAPAGFHSPISRPCRTNRASRRTRKAGRSLPRVACSGSTS